jgi:YggT family protein
MPSDLGGLVALILRLLSFAIIGRALLSWFDPGMNSTVGRFLFDLTEPIIAPIRRVVPSIGAFDLSPIIALLLINFLGGQLVRAL